MRKSVFAIHTGPVLVQPIMELFAELMPSVRLVNVVDDGLLFEVRAAGRMTSSVTRRIVGYGLLAQSSGASAILSTCSSASEAAEIMRGMLDIPVILIDEPMAEKAVSSGPRIAIVGTLPTTLEPTERLIRKKASESRQNVVVDTFLADGAFDLLLSGDQDGHDRLVLDEIRAAAASSDVIVLAQGSMARLLPSLNGSIAVPVLTSPRLGVEAVRKALFRGQSTQSPHSRP